MKYIVAVLILFFISGCGLKPSLDDPKLSNVQLDLEKFLILQLIILLDQILIILIIFIKVIQTILRLLIVQDIQMDILRSWVCLMMVIRFMDLGDIMLLEL